MPWREKGMGAGLLRGLIDLAVGRAGKRESKAGAVEKILIIRIDERMGDILLTTPLIRAVGRWTKQGHGTLDVLVSKKYSVVLRGNPWVSAVLEYDKRRYAASPIKWIRFLRQLRLRGYDAVIDASHPQVFSRTSAVLAYAAGAPIRIGHERGASEYFFTHPVKVIQPVDQVREADHKMSLLKPLGIDSASPRMEFHALEEPGGERARTKALDVLAGVTGKVPIIGLYPGGRKEEQRWPANSFITFAKMLNERVSSRFIVIWGPGEDMLASDVARAVPGAVMAPETDVLELAALLEVLDLFVTNDTGPMHLASAVGTAVVAVFLTGAGGRYGPRGRFSRVVDGLDGAPRPGKVVDAAMEILSSKEVAK